MPYCGHNRLYGILYDEILGTIWSIFLVWAIAKVFSVVPAPPNYPLRDAKYHLIETIRPLINRGILGGLGRSPVLWLISARDAASRKAAGAAHQPSSAWACPRAARHAWHSLDFPKEPKVCLIYIYMLSTKIFPVHIYTYINILRTDIYIYIYNDSCIYRQRQTERERDLKPRSISYLYTLGTKLGIICMLGAPPLGSRSRPTTTYASLRRRMILGRSSCTYMMHIHINTYTYE